MPSARDILAKPQGISARSILDRPVDPFFPEGPVDVAAPTLPQATFAPQPQPADVTAVAPQAPVVSPEAQEFLRTFSVPTQPTIGAAPTTLERIEQEAIREELTGLEPTTGVGLPGLKQAPEPGIVSPEVFAALPTRVQKTISESPRLARSLLAGLEIRAPETAERQLFERLQETQPEELLFNPEFQELDPGPEFLPFGSLGGFARELRRGFTGEQDLPAAVEAAPLAELAGGIVGMGGRFAALISGLQAAGLSGPAADALAGLISGAQRQIGAEEFDPLAPLTEAVELGTFGTALRGPAALRRAIPALEGRRAPIRPTEVPVSRETLPATIELPGAKPVQAPALERPTRPKPGEPITPVPVQPAAKIPIPEPAVAPAARPVAKVPEVPIKPEVAKKPPRGAGPPVLRESETGIAKTPEPKTVALNKAEIAKIRKGAGLEKLPDPQRKSFVQSAEEAKSATLDKTALTIADEVLGSRRQVTAAEHSGMVIKAGEIQNGLDISIPEMVAQTTKGSEGAARLSYQRNSAKIEELHRLTSASDIAGTETAQALSIRRLRVSREDFSVASTVQRGRAAKGSRLTQPELTKLSKAAKDVERLEGVVERLQKNNAKLLAEQDAKIAAQITKREAAKAKVSSRAETTRTAIKEQNVDLKKQLAGIGFRVNDITGLGPEAAYLVGRLAINYVRLGATNLKEVVRRVLIDVPDLTPQDVHQAINTRNPKAVRKARTDVTKRVQAVKTQARLLTEIDKIERGIFETPKPRVPTAPEIRALQTQLRKLRAETYKSGIDGKRLERAIQTINELEDQVATGFRPLRKAPKEITPELAAARTKIKDLRRTLKVEDELADLNQQLATGEFRIPAKPEPRRISPELERAEIELIDIRRRHRAAIEELQPFTPRRAIGEVTNTLRTLKATADMSGVARQGFVLSARRPKAAARAFGKSFRATFNRFKADQIDNGLRSMPEHFVRQKSGLDLPEIGGGLKRGEEFFASNWIKRVPVIRDIVAASERHMVTFLNLMRAGTFDDFVAKFPNATNAELRAWANWINLASGRGNLGRLKPFGNELATVFFAPRFAVSRIQTPLQVFRRGQTAKRPGGLPPRVRKEIAKDMAAVGAIGATALALADMAGWEVGTTPRESDFGKIKVGKTRVDLWAGMQQPMRLLIQLFLFATDKAGISGQELSDKDKMFDPIEAIERFGEYKLAPSITVPLELARGRTIVGEPVTPTQTAIRAIMPLVYEDIIDAYREEGGRQAAMVGGLVFFGVGASTFQDSPSRLRRDIRRLRANGEFTAANQKQRTLDKLLIDRKVEKARKK